MSQQQLELSLKMIHRVDRKIAIKVIGTFSKMQKILINCENILQKVHECDNATNFDIEEASY